MPDHVKPQTVVNIYVNHEAITEWLPGMGRGEHLRTAATKDDALDFIKNYSSDPKIIAIQRDQWDTVIVEYAGDPITWVMIKSELYIAEAR